MVTQVHWIPLSPRLNLRRAWRWSNMTMGGMQAHHHAVIPWCPKSNPLAMGPILKIGSVAEKAEQEPIPNDRGSGRRHHTGRWCTPTSVYKPFKNENWSQPHEVCRWARQFWSAISLFRLHKVFLMTQSHKTFEQQGYWMLTITQLQLGGSLPNPDKVHSKGGSGGGPCWTQWLACSWTGEPTSYLHRFWLRVTTVNLSAADYVILNNVGPK